MQLWRKAIWHFHIVHISQTYNIRIQTMPSTVLTTDDVQHNKNEYNFWCAGC